MGGGLVEHEAELLAMETLRSGTSALREFCLRAEGLERIGMVCGGDVTLAVQYLPGGAAGPLAATDAALRCLRAGGDGWLVSRLSTAEAGDLSFLEKEAAEIRFSALRQQAADEVLFEAEGKPWFAQRLIRSGAVYLFGGGHVAVSWPRSWLAWIFALWCWMTGRNLRYLQIFRVRRGSSVLISDIFLMRLPQVRGIMPL